MSPNPTLHTRLDELTDLAVAARGRVQESKQALEDIDRQIRELTDQIVEAHSTGDEAEATKLGKVRAKLEAAVKREATERVAGAQRAAQRADAERAESATHNLATLLAERQPDAAATAAAVDAAVSALSEAERAWEKYAGEVAALLRLAGADTATLPTFPTELHDLARSARRADGSNGPVPLPADHRHPDPERQDWAAKRSLTSEKETTQ